MAVLITVPILIAKINISKPKPESGVRNVSTHEADLMIAKNTSDTGISEYHASLITKKEAEPVFRGYGFIPFDSGFQIKIFDFCKRYGIEYDLILAVIKAETEFQWLTGDNGQAVGYMQIWSRWWQETANAAGLNINDPLDNIHMGIIILSDAIDENDGNLTSALKQYNSGNPDYAGNEYINKVYENIRWISDMKESR
jgi:soluble lytic murein transglycosylase-like protein